ncbi:alpha/beta fold hydrolase [Aliidongia dinghuensis]|nr:alpha/beta hydrolase [Aliidongia dinghuensis]
MHANGEANPRRGTSERILVMTEHIHETAPTQYVEANGIRFAYRRFGKAGSVPIVFNQHFQGTLDHWDPAVTNGLARTREVILFNNAGVASSSGETPSTFQEMGANAIAFIRALGLSEVDILGFSIGGMISQEIAVQAPELVRKLILVGTGLRGADMSTSQSSSIFGRTYEPAEHLWLKVHFTPSEASQAAGLAFLERKLRRQDRDPLVGQQTIDAQLAAIGEYLAYREVDGYLDYLKTIRQPTLVVQGSNDVIIPTYNSFVLQQTLPNAQLILYPDSNHGSFYQYPELFVAEATLFLGS